MDMKGSDLNRKKKVRAVAGLVAALVVISLGVSVVTTLILGGREDWSRHDGVHGHQWLRDELELSAGEAAELDALEPAYRQERAELQEQFEQKIEELRQQIIATDEFSAEVRETIHELHMIHGQLQELSIRHYYEMMRVLPAEKQARLRELASRALSTPE